MIIGFSVAYNSKNKVIYDNDTKIIARQINPYLIDGDLTFIDSRSKTCLSSLTNGVWQQTNRWEVIFLTPEEKMNLLRNILKLNQ